MLVAVALNGVLRRQERPIGDGGYSEWAGFCESVFCIYLRIGDRQEVW
ncbi:unnamed protein product [Soboliphyme baturini]|uniref:Transposase n=1 Tax=Soboliphyme baturini TaxID=241478 RepID=A0A183J8S6_9BILA|nr:unnamed protein product [Soboliphyme baturini]